MNYVVNIEDIETALEDLGGRSSAEEIKSKILNTFCNGKTPKNYAQENSFRQTVQSKIDDFCLEAKGFDKKKNPVKFNRVGYGIYQLANIENIAIPEEIENSETFIEGAVTEILVNSFERSPIARNACIEHYGVSCSVCDFNFEDTYGEIGKNFIHVHHLKPLHEIKEEYSVNPVNDLRPVCPNCHAMLHRGEKCLSISELKQKLTKKSS